MTGITYLLDYNLIVETLNHEIIKQTPDDTSRFGNGSFFGDIKDLRLRRASLVGKGHIFTVDLITGHVEIDGSKIYPPSPVFPGAKLELIYYRTVQQHASMKAATEKSFLGNVVAKLSELTPKRPDIKYFIGWQYSMNGKNYKWEMGVN
jgi:hypothetical protein